jgi:hypothetical protein
MRERTVNRRAARTDPVTAVIVVLALLAFIVLAGVGIAVFAR